MHELLAYIDPGSGSLIIQVVIATLVAIPIFFRTQITRIVNRSAGAPRSRRLRMTAPTETDRPASARATGDGPRPRLLPRPRAVSSTAATASCTARSTPRRSTTGRRSSRSGLAERLISAGPAHRPPSRRALDDAATPEARAVIRPDEIEFISYPYEWTFGELKDAALLTLDVELEALAAGWTLKDASAYNVQFRDATADPHRLALVRAPRGRRAVGRLPPVLRALPGAARADGPPRHPPLGAPARRPRRHPARPGQGPRAVAHPAELRAPVAPPPACQRAAPPRRRRGRRARRPRAPGSRARGCSR